MQNDASDELYPVRMAQRAAILCAIRQYFWSQTFIEIDAPVLVTSPGMEPHLDAFAVESGHGRRYLHTSPEYALKRAIGSGLRNVFSIVPCFRNEHPSSTHSPEFTMLEWYATHADLFELMKQVEEVVRCAARAVTNQSPLHELDLESPFERLTVREAFLRHTELDPWTLTSAEAFKAEALKKGIYVSDSSAEWDEIFHQVFLNAVEPFIGKDKPVFLWGWPASQAALSRLDPKDKTIALRFELFAAGIELANAFDELTDADEQRRRFIIEQGEREAAGRTVYPIDEALLSRLATMPPTAGIALGIDRLVMLLVGAKHIDEVRTQPW